MNINAVDNYIKDYKSNISVSTKTEYEMKSEDNQDNCKTYGNCVNSGSYKKDTIQISPEAYALQEQDKDISAFSGKDILGITRGSKKNTFVIRFSDSAMVSRAISRGYITVNGIKIELTDEVKKKLTECDSEAEKNRQNAFNKYIMQKDAEVAKQQGDAQNEMLKDEIKALEIASKLSRGVQVSMADEKKLMEFNPKLYIMAKNAYMMAKHHTKDKLKKEDEENNKECETSGEEKDGIMGNESFETFDTQMTVDLNNGNEKISDIKTEQTI